MSKDILEIFEHEALALAKMYVVNAERGDAERVAVSGQLLRTLTDTVLRLTTPGAPLDATNHRLEGLARSPDGGSFRVYSLPDLVPPKGWEDLRPALKAHLLKNHFVQPGKKYILVSEIGLIVVEVPLNPRTHKRKPRPKPERKPVYNVT